MWWLPCRGCCAQGWWMPQPAWLWQPSPWHCIWLVRLLRNTQVVTHSCPGCRGLFRLLSKFVAAVTMALHTIAHSCPGLCPHLPRLPRIAQVAQHACGSRHHGTAHDCTCCPELPGGVAHSSQGLPKLLSMCVVVATMALHMIAQVVQGVARSCPGCQGLPGCATCLQQSWPWHCTWFLRLPRVAHGVAHRRPGGQGLPRLLSMFVEVIVMALLMTDCTDCLELPGGLPTVAKDCPSGSAACV